MCTHTRLCVCVYLSTFYSLVYGYSVVFLSISLFLQTYFSTKMCNFEEHIFCIVILINYIFISPVTDKSLLGKT